MSNFNILIDTCFWIALYDSGDNYFDKAEKIVQEIENENLIIPFPTLYEFVNSRLSRREHKYQFQQVLKQPNVKLIGDEDYKFRALDNFFIKSNNSYNDISLVDEILKLIMQDKNLKIDYIVSFDDGLTNEAIAMGIKKISPPTSHK